MMLKGLGDIGNFMRLQKELKSAQKRISTATKEGVSPDGKVRAVVDGEHRLVKLSIDPGFLDASISGDVEKMIIEAVIDAGSKIKNLSAAEMKRFTGGLEIPGLGDFFK
jgi:DNA-binding protein YbaB